MQQRVQIFHRRHEAFVRHTTPHYGDTLRGTSYSVSVIIQHLPANVNRKMYQYKEIDISDRKRGAGGHPIIYSVSFRLYLLNKCVII